jgi:hypothetical protein
MTKRSRFQQRALETLESDFRALLPRMLRQSAAGRLGLFGQYDHLEERFWIFWPDAEQLKEQAREIQLIRQGFGESNSLADRFLHYCSLRGANVPGEPRLAQMFLDEIEASLPVAHSPNHAENRPGLQIR